MKKDIKKILLGSSALLSLSTIPVAGITTINSINTNSITKSDTSLQDVTINSLTMQLNKDYKNLDWYGKKFASSVTEEELKQLIVPSLKFDVNYGINILTPSDDALANGYVEFTVYQIKNNFNNGVTTAPSVGSSGTIVDGRTDIDAPNNIKNSDGTDSKIDMRAYTSDTNTTVVINGKTVKKSQIWTTKNISGLFLEHKYSFSWNDNEKIGDFLRDTSASTLTAQDVYTNMISTSKITDILPSDIVTTSDVITFSQEDSVLSSYGISSSDAKKYGIGVVTVDFSKSTVGNNASTWVNSTVPNQKYLVRGLTGTNNNGSKEEMHLNIDGDQFSSFLDTTFSVDKIKKQNPNFKLPSGASSNATSVKVSDFTPTELINALLTSTNGSSNILDLLTTRQYLNDSANATTLPPLYLTYMGKTIYDTASTTDSTKANQWNGTGLYQMGNVPTVRNGVIDYTNTTNPANDSKITAISASADNSTGTLYLNVTYNKYNVYQNSMEMGDEISIAISGLQSDDSQSINNDNLYFQWKTIDQLIFSNSSDVMSLYTKNSSDSSYLKSLSNSFFEGSENTYALDRTVTITSSDNTITITLTFPEYGNINGGWTFSNTYTFSNSSSSISVTFKNQKQVATTIGNALGQDLSTLTPSEVINSITTENSKGVLNLTDFCSINGSGYSTMILQNDTNDGIVIEITASDSNGNVTSKFSYFYNGMKKGTSSSYIYNFAFDTDDAKLQEGLTTLKTAIPFEQITASDVYNYYVANLPINDTYHISESDVSITKDATQSSITVSINIPITTSSSGNETSKVYTNTLKGFRTVTIQNNNSNVTVKNLTAPLSISFALAIVIIMSGLIIHLIIKRKKLAKSKINIREKKSK